jgi:hypothetical protein
MSITGFESAIQNNVKSYGDNLALLRDNSVMQRNNALAGLQGEFEKYSEVAKLGLELPVAIEGVKGIAGRAGDLYNFISKGGAKSALVQARGQIEGAAGNIKSQVLARTDELSQRLDNLRTTSAFGGETKMDFNPVARVKENAMRAKNDVEMTETDDPNYFETKHGTGGDYSYGGSVSSGETKTQVPAEEGFKGFDDLDEYGLPRASEPLGTGEPSLFSHEEPRFSTQRGLDSGFENDRMGIGNMGKSSRGAPLRKQSAQGYNELDSEERPPPRPTSKAPGAGEFDDELSNAASQAGAEEKSAASGLGDVLDSAAASTGGEIAGAAEEGIGAGLLASGIFAPIGALLEGLGAATELGSVGAGVYGAVESFQTEATESALRDKPLPTIRQPTLDLGGRVAAPILA